MALTLVSEFIAQEATDYVRGLLRDAIQDSGNSSRRFEFNRFEVTIDHEQGVVLVEDVLDAGETGMQSVPIKEFSRLLAGC